MGGGGSKYPLEVGREVANGLLEELGGSCRRSVVAGSIRRQKSLVGDVELVLEPSFQPALLPDMDETDMLDDGLRRSIAGGTILAMDRDRPEARYRKMQHVKTGMQCDLFIVREPAQFGLILAIRTGSARFSAWLLSRANKAGYTSVGGCFHDRGDDCDDCERGVDSAGQKCGSCNGRGWLPGNPVLTPTEEEVFALAGVPWKEPEDRNW